jgi:aminopeptidase N
MIVLDSSADKIILDTRDIDVESVVFYRADGDTKVATFEMGESDDVLGTPLIISVPASINLSSNQTIRVGYQTSPNASALQWLPPELTTGGKHPMMFSQSQSIHARSWVPLQDTPAVRITYAAVIRTPDDLLAGDRSLVSVIAHELAHSWSGNLVTNATWRDGWLNEGGHYPLQQRATLFGVSGTRVWAR